MDDEEEMFFRKMDSFLRNYRINLVQMNYKDFKLPGGTVEIVVLMWAFDRNIAMTFIN